MLRNRQDVYVPEILDAMTSERVLTMEFCEGTSLTDLEALKQEGPEVLVTAANIVTEVFSEQIFIHGNVHCDPHPGM